MKIESREENDFDLNKFDLGDILQFIQISHTTDRQNRTEQNRQTDRQTFRGKEPPERLNSILFISA